MIDSDIVCRQLRAAELPLLEAQSPSPREVRLQADRRHLPGLSDFLRDRFQARPELILAEDTRATAGAFTIRYVFELDQSGTLVIVSIAVPEDDAAFPSLATRWYLASRFEREIHDLFGLAPQEHPDLRRLPLHQFWPDGYFALRKDCALRPSSESDGAPYPFRRVEGEGLFEITVGPVHAGIIEPGHFRFTVEGETIVNLESRLYFVHKGIEKLFESMSFTRGVELAERISGDTSAGHALAYCHAIESLAGIEPPPRASYVRVVLLELERLSNHIADTGAICADTGFAVASAHTMRLREDLLRLNTRLTGNRLLRGTIVPGGVTRDFSSAQIADTRSTVERVIEDFAEVAAIALSNGMVLDRLHGTGRLSRKTAEEMQVAGLAARASGIDRDVRRDHPFDAYPALSFRVPVFAEGDVWARLMMRIEEARESASLIAQALELMPSGPLLTPVEKLPEGASALGVVEGWRGPVWHWVSCGPGSSLSRVKIKDPSFANWPALNYAILKNIVPDFPLVNKSFNLSYAGNDL